MRFFKSPWPWLALAWAGIAAGYAGLDLRLLVVVLCGIAAAVMLRNLNSVEKP